MASSSTNKLHTALSEVEGIKHTRHALFVAASGPLAGEHLRRCRCLYASRTKRKHATATPMNEEVRAFHVRNDAWLVHHAQHFIWCSLCLTVAEWLRHKIRRPNVNDPFPRCLRSQRKEGSNDLATAGPGSPDWDSISWTSDTYLKAAHTSTSAQRPSFRSFERSSGVWVTEILPLHKSIPAGP